MEERSNTVDGGKAGLIQYNIGTIYSSPAVILAGQYDISSDFQKWKLNCHKQGKLFGYSSWQQYIYFPPTSAGSDARELLY